VDNCKTCSSASQCSECKINYYRLSATECTLCNTENFAKNDGASPKTCIQCQDSNCKLCGTDGVCTECKNDWYLSGTNCITCDAVALMKSSLTCVSCVPSCLNCDTQTTCLKCSTSSNSNFRVKKSDRTECQVCISQNNLLIVGDYCYSGSDCVTNCLLCASAVTCATCNDGYFLTNQAQCQQCPSNCLTCNTNSCLTCSGSNKLLDGRCDPCTDDGLSASGDNCFRCTTANCLKCSSASTCTQCKTNFWLDSSAACVECGVGYRQYTDSVNKCERCSDSNCKICQAAAGTCTRCFDDESNSKFLFDASTCSACSAHSLIQKSDSTSTCKTCVTNCVKCTDTGICMQCTANYYVKYSTKNECVACSPSETEARIGDYCLGKDDCTPNCKLCETLIGCATCIDGYYLSGTSNKLCFRCPTDCTLCTSYYACTKCNSGYFLLSGTCVACGVAGGTNQEGQTNAGNLLLFIYVS
jgi:hypothetical protein